MLEISHVSYAYDSIQALQDVSLTIDEGEVLCLLGPSGCGKTTLLRVIAGLEAGYTGIVEINNEDISSVPVHERDFGLMFQDFALFPHMSVEKNVAYGLKRKGWDKHQIRQQVDSMLKKVGLSGFEKRDVNMLSGGQKQRVALARSLAPNPRLLMLDEPLGALDALLRDQLLLELREIIKTIGLTAIYVTHDQKEAYAIADRVAVMNEGRIEQVDTPQNLYYRPETQFVARFLGLYNLFHINSFSLNNSLPNLKQVDFNHTDYFVIHPVGIHLQKPLDGSFIELKGQIDQLIFRGDDYQIVVKIAEKVCLKWTVKQVAFSVGDEVSIWIDPNEILPLL